MKNLLISIILFTSLFSSTWQNIESPIEPNTNLYVQTGSMERSIIEFSISGFHLVPVETPEGQMYQAQLEDGASLLQEGAPDMHKYARSIAIPDNKTMAVVGLLIP